VATPPGEAASAASDLRTGSATAAGARQWLPGYLALAVIWGSSFLFIKVGLRELHPMHVALDRIVFGAVTLLVMLAVTRIRLPRDLRVWGHLAVVGFFGAAVPFTLFSYGEQHVSSVLAGIWNATVPLVALPMAVLAFRTETMTGRRAVGLALGFVGVLTILGVWQGIGESNLIGQLMCFGAALSYGIAIPYQKRFLAGRSETGVSLAAGQLIMATVQLGIVAALVAGAPPLPWTLSWPVLASVAALGAFGTGIAFAMSFRVIRLAGVATATSVTYVIPIWATLMGVVILHEQLTWYQPVGAAIVLIGVAISQTRNGRR
jgi:drug/metabolite transporter (DMT)-like permease